MATIAETYDALLEHLVETNTHRDEGEEPWVNEAAVDCGMMMAFLSDVVLLRERGEFGPLNEVIDLAARWRQTWIARVAQQHGQEHIAQALVSVQADLRKKIEDRAHPKIELGGGALTDQDLAELGITNEDNES